VDALLSGSIVDDRDNGPTLLCAVGAVLRGVNEPDLVALTLAESGYLEDDKPPLPASIVFGIDLALSYKDHVIKMSAAKLDITMTKWVVHLVHCRAKIAYLVRFQET
jgi:hypothetical protein